MVFGMGERVSKGEKRQEVRDERIMRGQWG